MGVFLSFIGIIGETLVMPSAPSSVRKHIVWTISDKKTTQKHQERQRSIDIGLLMPFPHLHVEMSVDLLVNESVDLFVDGSVDLLVNESVDLLVNKVS